METRCSSWHKINGEVLIQIRSLVQAVQILQVFTKISDARSSFVFFEKFELWKFGFWHLQAEPSTFSCLFTHVDKSFNLKMAELKIIK